MYLNAVEINSSSGRLGSGAPKDLYMCSSWEELEGKVHRNNMQVFTQWPTSVKEALDALNKMCLAAATADVENDEELAVVNYSRYLTACSWTLNQKKDDEYKGKLDHSDELKIRENMELTMKIFDVLKYSLTFRYFDAKCRVQRLENEIKIVRPVLEQHRINLEAEMEASKKLKRTRDELKSLYTVSQLLEEETVQQQNKKRLLLDNDNFPEQLQCPVCFEVYHELVFQCKNGHNICSTCYKGGQIKVCPECRDIFGKSPVRNRALEGLVSSWGFDCPYRENGCQKKVLCKQMTEHTGSCFFKKSEKRRQIGKVEMQIKEKEDELNECQAILKEASAQRVKTKTEWWKLQLNDKFAAAIEKVVKELNLPEMEQQLQ